MQDSAPSDVAIVGYGPAGATLAGLLGRCGLRVSVFEKAADVYAQPRAVGFDHDAMRIFQRVGIAEALAPHVSPFSDGEYLGVDGSVIRRVRRTPPPYPLSWNPNYSCDQPGVEAVLRDAVGRMPNVNVRLATEVTRAADMGDRVQLDARDAAGAVSRHEARYVVACDGASSPLRRGLGIELESLEYDEPWVVVDVRVEEKHLAQLPSTNVQYCEPERPCSFITCPGNHRRWEFMTLAGEPTEGALTEERLWKLLARWLKPGEATIWRAAAYRFHALIARDWRRGRILLAGDSAHQTPPFLGQGMCQGLRDAGNLAWKLESVLRGRSPEALLDSYGEERRPHVIETTRLAKEFGRLISERDPARARARDAKLLAHPGGAQTLIRQELIPGLSTGLVARDAPLAGRVFPQPRVRAGGTEAMLLDDVMEPCFRLVTVEQGGLLVQAIGTPDVVRIEEHEGLLARWLAAAGCHGALVRPDHYVYGGFTSNAGAERLLQELSRSSYAHPEFDFKRGGTIHASSSQ